MSRNDKKTNFKSNRSPMNDGSNSVHNRTNQNGDTDTTEQFGNEFGQELSGTNYEVARENGTMDGQRNSNGVVSERARNRTVNDYKNKLGK